MNPTGAKPSFRKAIQSARHRAVDALVRMVTLETASDLVQFAGGGMAVALGIAGMFLGLGPIGLALIFHGAAILLMNWETYHSPRAPTAPSGSDRARRGG